MIITLGGHLGSGKSTLGKRLAESLKYKHYSTGGFMRDMALERGISIIELNHLAESDGGAIDLILDTRQKNLWEKEDNFIIEGRLAFHFIPHAVKVFLTVDSHEAARRVYHDDTRRWVERHFDIEEAARNIEIRRKSEEKRYLQYYGVQIYDMSLYDIVVDTTLIDADAVFEEVMMKLRA